MELEYGFAKAIIDKISESTVAKIKGFVKDEWEKFKIDSGIAFDKYLQNSYDKYSKIKTVLYRTEPKYIYDFFEYPTLKLENKTFNSIDVDNLLNISNFIIVQGTGGIGKSTFMKHLFLNELSKSALIPIFVELKDYNEFETNSDITEFIFKKLYNLGCEFDKKYIEYALKSGCFLFLLDGYDEIVTNKRDMFFKQITDFSDKYSTNFYIISSRPYSNFVELQRFTVLEIIALSKKQAVSLIKKIDYDEEVKANFIKALNLNLYTKHKSFASNPLLLNIMLMTYDNYAEIPEKLHLFYSNAFDTLYFKHDATKGAYKRELRSKLSFDSFKKIFSQFCFITYYNGQIEFSYEDITSILKKISIRDVSLSPDDIIYDLTNSICVIYKDGLNYKFTHRSFQEYFSALYLKELPDDKMTQVAIKLLKKDAFRCTFDNTFPMLFDMCTERVERNIIMPLLAEYEEDYDYSYDRYDFYCQKEHIEFLFDETANNSRRQMFLRKTFASSIFDFIETAFLNYYLKNNKSLFKDIESNETQLLSYITEKMDYEIGEPIKLTDLKNDEIAYNLVKKTWVGIRIQTMSELSELLKEKQKEFSFELDEFLI